ncbi:aminoglycoside phosphotransferase family protein [Nostoc sp. PCC 7107]|uniref:aminoglycoside phosphotransferase family protein n=1 Tax=Nostoc sp. PCC 7107 TaxID=317936 RepID=UPI00029F4066|nr:aminoglycoside phosphotransferase family protein [Nostoc sp. PCC 7107]AFY41373.1 aminoglycoside phosphotransferase [Nostoc sp. PCC 7107]
MTSTPERSRLENAINAACAVAKQQGLNFAEAVILQDRSNLVIHLQPVPVVARIATTTGTVRFGDAWFAKEVAVASYLAAAGAPVVSPSNLIQPGPHQHNGFVLSFWEFVEEIDELPDATIVGQTLRDCHKALVDFASELTVLDPLNESESLLCTLISQAAFSLSDSKMLQAVNHRLKSRFQQLQLSMQPLHGDSNFSNVLNTTRGVLWTDWEDTFIGHIAWDIACLIAASHVFGTDREYAAVALNGYGLEIDQEILDLFIEARTFQTAMWNFIIGQQRPESLERLEGRLNWLRDRYRTVS